MSTLALDGYDPVPLLDFGISVPEMEYVHSWSAQLPDPQWAFTDANGHEHHWHRTDRDAMANRSAALPKLVASQRHIPCDGTCGNWDCDGYDITVWHCRECGVPVKPGYVPDIEAQTTGVPIVVGARRVTATVDRWPPMAGSGTYSLPRDPYPGVFQFAEGEMSARVWVTEVESRGGEMLFRLEATAP